MWWDQQLSHNFWNFSHLSILYIYCCPSISTMTETLHVCGFMSVLIDYASWHGSTNQFYLYCRRCRQCMHRVFQFLAVSSSLPDLQQLSPDYQEGSWLALAVFSGYPWSGGKGRLMGLSPVLHIWFALADVYCSLRKTWPVHRSCDLIMVKPRLTIPALCNTSSFGYDHVSVCPWCCATVSVEPLIVAICVVGKWCKSLMNTAVLVG